MGIAGSLTRCLCWILLKRGQLPQSSRSHGLRQFVNGGDVIVWRRPSKPSDSQKLSRHRDPRAGSRSPGIAQRVNCRDENSETADLKDISGHLGYLWQESLDSIVE